MKIPTPEQHQQFLQLLEKRREDPTFQGLGSFIEFHDLWSPTIIDGGCTTLEGLAARVALFRELHGEAQSMRPHPAGIALDFDLAVRILLTL